MSIRRIRNMLYKVLRYFVRHKSRSYLSFDFALSFYGLIPEAVRELMRYGFEELIEGSMALDRLNSRYRPATKANVAAPP